ncbi:MAG: hypothetical protein LJE70_08755 [Chromatiaceae bacterium]|nr:hypothetical protein [Chromatiaceae bacterium]
MTDTGTSSDNEGIDIVDVDGGIGANPDMLVNCPSDGSYGGNGSNNSEWPCDLFQYLFGVRGPYSDLYGTPIPDGWEDIRDSAEVITDCGLLDDTSSGLYWYEGAGDCTIGANTTVGTWKRPVLLILDEADLRANGGATFFGLIFSLDKDGGGAGGDVALTGTFLLYGSLVTDHAISLSAGTFVARYSSEVLANLGAQAPTLAYLPGGWSDFPPEP